MENRVHISLEVSDLRKSVEFYKTLFQKEPTKLRADYANFRMESPQLHLSLVENKNYKPTQSELEGNRHYGIELFDDAKLQQWLQTIKQAGINHRIEEEVTCCYAVANKFWVRDPEGNHWEFWVRQHEAEAMHVDVSNKLPLQKDSACCAPASSAQ